MILSQSTSLIIIDDLHPKIADIKMPYSNIYKTRSRHHLGLSSADSINVLPKDDISDILAYNYRLMVIIYICIGEVNPAKIIDNYPRQRRSFLIEVFASSKM